MYYARYDDLLRPTWTLTTGTEQSSDYVVGNLGGQPDPSLPVWITGTSIDLRADLGAAHTLGAIALIAHTFDAALDVRFEANTTSSFTSPAFSHAITIETGYNDGFACHAILDLTALSVSYRYLRIYNAAANSRTVAIGDIILATSWRVLDPSIAHPYQRPQQHYGNKHTSKRGVQTVYDLGSRGRQLLGKMNAIAPGDLDTVLDWSDEQHQFVRPMLIQLDPASASRRGREPHLARFIQAVVNPTSQFHEIAYDVEMQFEELGCGEVIGA
jgi:hypothetical protein